MAAFRKALEDPAPEVRAAAVQLLVQEAGLTLVQDLASLVDDPDDAVVVAAAGALRDLSHATEEPLRQALAAESPHVRTTTVAYIGEAMDAREKVLEGEIARLDREREQLCGEIDASLLSRYSRISARRRPAVVLVSKEMCVGCRVGIPPQNYIEILRGESLITCGNCHRILVHQSKLPSRAAR